MPNFPIVCVDTWDMALPSDFTDALLPLTINRALDERVAMFSTENERLSPVYLLVMDVATLIPLLRLESISSLSSNVLLLGVIAKNRGRISGTQANATATLGSTPLKMMTGKMAYGVSE